MWIEKEEETEHAMCIKSRTIWPKTIGRRREEKGK